MVMSQNRVNSVFQVVIHTIAWVLMFLSPIFFSYMRNETFSWIRYLDFCVNPVSFMSVFYINYCWLIDRQLFGKHIARFIVMNLVLIAIFVLIQHGWHGLFRNFFEEAQPEPKNRHAARTELFLVFIFLWNAILLGLTVALSVAIKMTANWYHVENEKREIEKEDSDEAHNFAVLYLVTVFIGALALLLLPGIDFTEGLYEVASGLSGTGQTIIDFFEYQASHEAYCYEILLWVINVAMFLGRLEIIPLFSSIKRVFIVPFENRKRKLPPTLA